MEDSRRHIILSFSQASTYNQCERRWAYRYLYELESVPGPALVHGSKVHKEIEDYLNNEVLLVETDSLGMKAKAYIESQPLQTFQVETHLEYVVEDTTIHGYADVILYNSDGTKTIIDWKTANKKPKTMKPEHQAQLHLYGFMAGLTQGDLLTIAYPEYGIIFDIDYDPKHAEYVVEWMIDTAEHIRNIHDTYDKNADEKNFDANTTPLCGWCDYLDKCEEGKAHQQEYERIKIQRSKRRK